MNRIFTKRAIVLTIAVLFFVLNIAVSSQLEKSGSSLGGVVSYAFAEEEGSGSSPSMPGMSSIEPNSGDDSKLEDADEGVIDYIIGLFK